MRSYGAKEPVEVYLLLLSHFLVTVEGASWWRWPVKKLSDGGVFFDKRFWLLFWRMQKVTKPKKNRICLIPRRNSNCVTP